MSVCGAERGQGQRGDAGERELTVNRACSRAVRMLGRHVCVLQGNVPARMLTGKYRLKISATKKPFAMSLRAREAASQVRVAP